MTKNKHQKGHTKEMYHHHVHFKSQAFKLLGGGLFCITLGLVVDQLFTSGPFQNISGSVKYILSMIFPVTGAIIIAQVMPFFFSKLPCNDCEVKTKIEGDRWCRWLGPISNVLPKRSGDFLTEFFKGAKEIDILTPNLHEVNKRPNPFSSLKKSNAKVRMMSLHPECLAVYRRFNDMGPSQEIRSREIYSSLIRGALVGLHNERPKNKNWEIRTYTFYPVITIFRADDRFLLGFPLRGCRVREQFHIELNLPKETIGELGEIYVMKGENEDKLNPDKLLGAGVRRDLMRHFDSIWEDKGTNIWEDKDTNKGENQTTTAPQKKETSILWVSRVEIFKKMLDLDIPQHVTDCIDCEHACELKNKGAKFKDIIRLYSITHCGASCDTSKQKELTEKSLQHVRANLDNATEEVKNQYHIGDDNVCELIFDNFLKIISDIFEVTIGMNNTSAGGIVVDNNNKNFIKMVTEKLSQSISSGRYGFEDCSELLFIMRNKNRDKDSLIPREKHYIWEDVWFNLKEQAKNWSR